MDKEPTKMVKDGDDKIGSYAKIVANCLTELVGAKFVAYSDRVKNEVKLTAEQELRLKECLNHTGTSLIRRGEELYIPTEEITKAMKDGLVKQVNVERQKREANRISDLREAKIRITIYRDVSAEFNAKDKLLMVRADSPYAEAYIKNLLKLGIMEGTEKKDIDDGLALTGRKGKEFVMSAVNIERLRKWRHVNPDILETESKRDCGR